MKRKPWKILATFKSLAIWASQVALVVKNSPANAGDKRDAGLISGSGRIPWWRTWQPSPVFLPGESHGQRSLEGYSPWGRREVDMASRLRTHAIGLSTLGISFSHFIFQSAPRFVAFLPPRLQWPLMPTK